MIKYVSIRKLKEGVDPEQYEKYYREKHLPLAKKMPGVRKGTIAKLRDWGTQPAPYYRMTELFFDDYESLEKCFSSPEGQAATNDLELQAMTGEGIKFIAEEEQIIP